MFSRPQTYSNKVFEILVVATFAPQQIFGVPIYFSRNIYINNTMIVHPDITSTCLHRPLREQRPLHVTYLLI